MSCVGKTPASYPASQEDHCPAAQAETLTAEMIPATQPDVLESTGLKLMKPEESDEERIQDCFCQRFGESLDTSVLRD